MEGVVLDELRVYVAQRYGYRAWLETLKRSGRPATHQYALERIYPDEELGQLARSAVEVTHVPLNDLMEGFGQSLAPNLMRIYPHFVEPGWSFVDFLLNVAPILHKALQLDTKVHARRLATGAVRITYNSPLQACAAVKGVILGAAREYRVTAAVVQSQCVLAGDRECVFDVRVQPRT